MSTVQACPVNRNTPLRSPNCTSSFRKKWGYTEELFCGFRAASSLQAAKIKFLACGTGSVRVPLVAQFDVAGSPELEGRVGSQWPPPRECKDPSGKEVGSLNPEYNRWMTCWSVP
ncbi:unnamed protein product [Symbiodinium natans]|uniref:Uncharacterized protein n=1 Tax=Symbiodinium natans TaxID=878477 RepID=A0A812IQ91_9DINO|nr:unnamed protein product [Symbiodinium natans]